MMTFIRKNWRGRPIPGFYVFYTQSKHCSFSRLFTFIYQMFQIDLQENIIFADLHLIVLYSILDVHV